ncbi:hypothetical protein DMUE_1407 [Dictyocoela muelleri]|nr:hypothetical protein DMUE_1407 [Dictyocoela muelleri]
MDKIILEKLNEKFMMKFFISINMNNISGVWLKEKKRAIITKKDIETIKRLVNDGKNEKEISRICHISLKTAYNLLGKLHQCAELGLSTSTIIKNKGRKAKDNTEAKLKIVRKISEDLTYTQVGIKTALSYSGYDISTSKISRILKKEGITRKRLKKISINRDNDINKNYQFEYSMSVNRIRNEEIIYIDETGFNLHTSTNYG